jgi:dTDP-4-dehydrorhamnose reductase
MKIIITGKTGILSQEIQKSHPEIIALNSIDYDITNDSIVTKLSNINPDIIIHAAAVTDSNTVKENPIQAINVNIIGTAHMAKYCSQYNKRLVYISTDYVYEGIKGMYSETDPVLPYNEYAWTKLGGECSVKLVLNHLIIRTSFGPSKFPYDKAWTNQIVSKDYIDIISPMILKATTSDLTGVLNIGTEPKSLYEYAKRRNEVNPIQKKENKNFTLNTKKYEQSFSY